MNEEKSNESELDNPVTNVDEPKSKKKFFLFGGIGCLGLIAILCSVAAFWMSVVKPRMEFLTENAVLLESNEQAIEIFGTPLTLGDHVLSEADNKMTVRTPVSGPNGSGVCILVGKLEDGVWVRDSITVEKDGESYDLEDPDAMFDLDISFGD